MIPAVAAGSVGHADERRPQVGTSGTDPFHGLFSWCTFRERTSAVAGMEKWVRDVRVLGPKEGFSGIRTMELDDPADLKIIFLLTRPTPVFLRRDFIEIHAVPAPQYAPSPGDPIAAPGETLYPYLFTNTGGEGNRIFEYGENAFELHLGEQQERKSLPFELTVRRPETEAPAGVGLTVFEGDPLSEQNGRQALMMIPSAWRAAKQAALSGNPADCLATLSLPGCAKSTEKYCLQEMDADGIPKTYPAFFNACSKQWVSAQGAVKPRQIGLRYITSAEMVDTFSNTSFSLKDAPERLLQFFRNPLSTPEILVSAMIMEATQMPEWVIVPPSSPEGPTKDAAPSPSSANEGAQVEKK